MSAPAFAEAITPGTVMLRPAAGDRNAQSPAQHSQDASPHYARAAQAGALPALHPQLAVHRHPDVGPDSQAWLLRPARGDPAHAPHPSAHDSRVAARSSVHLLAVRQENVSARLPQAPADLLGSSPQAGPHLAAPPPLPWVASSLRRTGWLHAAWAARSGPPGCCGDVCYKYSSGPRCSYRAGASAGSGACRQ